MDTGVSDDRPLTVLAPWVTTSVIRRGRALIRPPTPPPPPPPMLSHICSHSQTLEMSLESKINERSDEIIMRTKIIDQSIKPPGLQNHLTWAVLPHTAVRMHDEVTGRWVTHCGEKKPVYHSSEIIGANKERGCALECPRHIKEWQF